VARFRVLSDGFEPGSLTLNEEHVPKMFEKDVEKVPKREATGTSKQHEQLQNLYSTPNIIKAIKLKSTRMRNA
jgi:hypothetical protein